MDGIRSILLVCLGSHMGARLMFALQNIVSRQIRLNLAQKTEE